MITPQQLRYDFPEFSSNINYPNSGINFWITIAYKLLNADRWGEMLDLGVELFVAHNITLEARAALEAAGGGIPGQNSGPLSSKSVDKVAVSYDTGAAMEEGAGHWNLTVYGTRYRSLVRLFGAGPVQIGIGFASPLSSANAWPGLDTNPGQTTFG